MIDILVFRPLISTTRRIEPAEKELVLNAARNIQHVTTMILNNATYVNATVREMLAESLIQQATRLMEHHDGGSLKARRRKSCKK